MIKEYKKKDGSKAYMLVAYLGVDPLTGKQKRTTRRGFKTKRDATIAEAKLLTDIQENGFTNNETMTFRKVFNVWHEQYKLTVRESTLHRSMNQFNKQILPVFGNLKINTITTLYCQKIVNEWFKTYKSAKNLMSYTNLIFEYAIKIKVIKENPMKLVSQPKVDEVITESESLFYTKEELQKFLTYLESEPVYHAIFRVLAFTGMRRGELMALNWDDLDVKNGTISINKTVAFGTKNRPYIGPPKTKKSIRKISLDETTINILLSWKLKQKELLFMHGILANKKEQLIFSNTTTNKIFDQSRLTRKIGEVCRKHGMKRIKVHGFRHTHCSLLFESGATIQEVQERLGHSNIKTTMDIYAHVTENQREKLANQFAAYMNF